MSDLTMRLRSGVDPDAMEQAGNDAEAANVNARLQLALRLILM